MFLCFGGKSVQAFRTERVRPEIDFMFQGNILHRIVELLLTEYPDLNITQEQLSALYDDVLRDGQTGRGIAENVLEYWGREKFRHLLMIERFIEDERQWRQTHPHLRVVALEAEVNGYIGIENGALVLSRAPREGFLAFHGKIDRVDRDHLGNYGIYDYKTSKQAGMVALKNGVILFQIQMPLYAASIESGLVEALSPASVVMAYYVFFKDSQRGSFPANGREQWFYRWRARSKERYHERNARRVFETIQNQVKDIFIKNTNGAFYGATEGHQGVPIMLMETDMPAPHMK